MTRLGVDPLIYPECEITENTFGSHVEIGKGSWIAFSHFDEYSYCDRYAGVANAHIGKFANIAAVSRIGATDHPLHTASLHHFLYRSDDYWDYVERDTEFFAQRKSRIATIGHDTWIGAETMVKPEVTLGHGAVAAAGAVVTKDVAPYTIVAGTLAKPMLLRQPKDIADRLIA